jgi:hypothetical protein
MSVKGSDLENPEKDLDLTTRDPKGTPAVLDAIHRVKSGKPSADSELQALRARMDTARGITPQGAELHCRDCWEKGRNAAIRTIEGDKGA